jgi:hypothetical protein
VAPLAGAAPVFEASRTGTTTPVPGHAVPGRLKLISQPQHHNWGVAVDPRRSRAPGVDLSRSAGAGCHAHPRSKLFSAGYRPLRPRRGERTNETH